MKAVLISIRPEWCWLIASSKKLLEIRKTRPKIDGQFKVYIYCTKARRYASVCGDLYEAEDTLFRLPSGEIKCDYPFELIAYHEGQYNKDNFLNGKVIGEFICDGIIRNCETANADIAEHYGCLKREELMKYSNGKELFGWHISDLKIYDKPKELYEFYRKCEEQKCEACEHLKYQRVNSSEYDYDCEFIGGHIPITRPPQSWCYVEEVRG